MLAQISTLETGREFDRAICLRDRALVTYQI